MNRLRSLSIGKIEAGFLSGKETFQMLELYFFILGVVNNLFLIAIFWFRKIDRLSLLRQIGKYYLLLGLPAVFGIFLVQHEQKAVQYSIFLGLFLAFLALEALYDFILEIPFRQNWKLLTPYLILYYAMNYGFVVMVWKNSLSAGIFMLCLFIIQIAVNLSAHKKKRNPSPCADGKAPLK